MNYICAECIGDSYLKAEIKDDGIDCVCDYCKEEDGKCYTAEELADLVEHAFEIHYNRTADQPDEWQSMLLRDRESKYEWEREGEEVVYVIADALGVNKEIAREIQQILEERHSDQEMARMGKETEFSSEAHYEERIPTDYKWHVKWDELEVLLKKKRRYFNATARNSFKDIFHDVESLRTTDGKPLVYELGESGSSKVVFRARYFDDFKSIQTAFKSPHFSLGAPPHEYARAGRMNAEGISVFYGATTPEVALSEIRPPVGSYVVISKSETIRPIRVLDLSRIRNVKPPKGSIFDPAYTDTLLRIEFLKIVADKICKPVTPFHERFEYLVTQALSEYLEQSADFSIDGVIYNSTQSSSEGKNMVLLHNSSKVGIPEAYKEIEFEANLVSRGPDEAPEFVIYQKNKTKTDSDKCRDAFTNRLHLGATDGRPVTLRFLMDSFQVHKIRGIAVDTYVFDSSMHKPFDLKDPAF